MGKQYEAFLNDLSVVLEKGDLAEAFGRLEGPRAWHRLSERVSQINKLLRPLGVEFVLDRSRCRLRAYFSSPEVLQEAVGLLGRRRGYVQKAFAACLQERATLVADRRAVPGALRQAQLQHLRHVLTRDLGPAAGADLDALLIAPPFLKDLAKALPGPVALTGESGAGKTALLYMLLRDWARLAPRAADRPPLYVPARQLRLEWGPRLVAWEALPGVEPAMAERLEEAFRQGRLTLLIDGLEENPDCLDFRGLAVQAFWKAARRNACVLTASPGYYEASLRGGPLEALAQGRLERLQVPSWGAGDFRALFSALRRAAPGRAGLPSALGGLDKLSVEDWRRRSPLVRSTPLTALACVDFMASRGGSRLPESEFELLEHLTGFLLRRDEARGPAPAVLGALMELCWKAYLDGQVGPEFRLPLSEVGAAGGSELLAFLQRLPYASCDPRGGAVALERRFAEILVARRIIHVFQAGNYRRIRETIARSYHYAEVGRLYYEGLRSLDPARKRLHLEASRRVYDAVWQEYLRDKSFDKAAMLSYLLQPLGFLGLPEASELMWKVFDSAPEDAEHMRLFAAGGLAWSGDGRAMEAYVERMRSRRASADFNLTFHLFYCRPDRSRRDIENFTPELIGDWEPVCDWLLRGLRCRCQDHVPQRPLFAFTLWNFLRRMGPAPFSGPAGADRRAALDKILDDLSAWRRSGAVGPAARRSAEELAALARRLGVVQRGKHEEREEPSVAAP